jgi:uncharacterized protein (TIGR02300 family)
MGSASKPIFFLKGPAVVKAELGTKRTCPSCASRFYDLLKNPIVCPKCGVSFIAAPILPSKGDYPGAAAAPAPKPREKVEVEESENADVELISLEDVEEEEEGDNVSGLLDSGPGGKEGEEEV